MCKVQPATPVTKPKSTSSCPRPRRSKLGKLRRLQSNRNVAKAAKRQVRSQPNDDQKKKAGVTNLCQPHDEAQLPKRQKTEAVQISAGPSVVADSDAHSSATPEQSVQLGAAADAAPAAVGQMSLFSSKQSSCTAKSVREQLQDAIDATTLRAQLQLRIEDDPYGDCPAPVKSFDQLALPRHVLSSLQRHGITAPMPIQAQALPLVLSGRDVIGLAQTGSGKTLAFLLPAAVFLEKEQLSQQPRVPSPFVLIMAPTRELAVQIGDEANKVFDTSASDAGANKVHTVALYGGGDKWTQQKQLRWGAHIVVATPGRLNDFVNTNVMTLSRVKYFVLDEADRMLDMGFQDEVAGMSKQMPAQRQILFFSATWGKEVQQLAAGLCRSGSKPVRISYGQQDGTSSADGTPAKFKAREGIVQEVVVVDHSGGGAWEKQEAEKDVIMEKHLESVLSASAEHKVLVFVSQKTKADKLSERLQKQGFKADSMHGGKSQDYRLWVLEQFRKGELRLLVCTDVLGRGIDIPSVSHVVIHEMGEVEDYVHRIGRTARGQYGKGHALVFFEYWDGSPEIASEFIDLLAASKQPIPAGLQTIADEVASGKRQARPPAWKAGSSWNKR